MKTDQKSGDEPVLPPTGFAAEKRGASSLLFLQIAGLLCGQVILTVGTLLFPRWVGRYIDYLVQSETGGQAVATIGQMLIFVFVLAALTFVLNRAQIRFLNRRLALLREEGLGKMLRVDLAFQNNQKPSAYSGRLVHDLDTFKEGLGMGVWQLPAQIILLLGSLWFLFQLHFVLALIVLVLTPQCLWLTFLIARQSKKKYRIQQELQMQMLAMVDEDIAHPALLRTLNLLAVRAERYAALNHELLEVGQKAQFYSSLTNPAARLVNHFTYICVGVGAVILAMRGELTYGEIAATLSFTLLFAEPINQLSLVYGQLQKALVSWQRVRHLHLWPDFAQQQTGQFSLSETELKMENVSFSYRKEQPFIENLNVTFFAGKMTAVVGGTGSGKTTLVHLLLRFYQPEDGHIYWGGQDIDFFDRARFYRQVGFILQESWIFSSTVAENIAYGLTDVSSQAIRQAAEKSCAAAFIERLPEGYETFLGPGGYELSQGQKQLLTLARIFLRQPPLLIFDEATSNVDVQTERKVQAALRDLMQNRTSIIIAHRLSTIQAADQIIVMDEGKIVERGTHAELLATKGYYWKMYRSQFYEQDAL